MTRRGLLTNLVLVMMSLGTVGAVSTAPAAARSPAISNVVAPSAVDGEFRDLLSGGKGCAPAPGVSTLMTFDASTSGRMFVWFTGPLPFGISVARFAFVSGANAVSLEQELGLLGSAGPTSRWVMTFIPVARNGVPGRPFRRTLVVTCG